MATLVMKFGGSLTADAKQLNRAVQIILAEALAWQRMVVVISAKAGATDDLSRAVDQAAACSAAGFRRIVAALRSEHIDLIQALFKATSTQKHLIQYLDRRLFEVLAVCERVMLNRQAQPRDRDAVMAVGEQVMAHIVAEMVQQEGLRAALIEAESVIITDANHQNAHPLLDLIDRQVDRVLRPVLDAEIVPIIAGFVGATKTGALTTLGRGGSDYTATLLGASLRADEVWMWTSVDGIMSADPALVPGARVISALTYEEVGELSYFGARVLHPGAVEPLAQRGIPLRVRNPSNLDHAGTLIQAELDEPSPSLKAVTAVDGVCLSVSRQPFDLSAFLSKMHDLVGSAATGPVIVMQSHHRATLVFVVPTSEGPQAVESVVQRLEAGLPRWEIQPVKVVAAIGKLAPLRTTLDDTIRPLASVIGPGNRRLLAVPPGDVKSVVRQLHKLIEATSTGTHLAQVSHGLS